MTPDDLITAARYVSSLTFPTTKRHLVAQVTASGAPHEILEALRALYDEHYASEGAVVAALIAGPR